MNKRNFIKLTAAGALGGGLLPAAPPPPDGKLSNWSENFEFSTTRWYEPKTVEQVREVVKAHPKLKAIGTRHCFNGIAQSSAWLDCNGRDRLPVPPSSLDLL